MNIIRVTNDKTSLYKDFLALYSISFPVFEQRTAEQQILAFKSSYYHLDIYLEEETLIGFISYWEFRENIYIEHLAINSRFRGNGYGSAMLNEFISKNIKPIILEIDPIVDDISAARLRFYERCGFLRNSHNHSHPPYVRGNKAHSLVVLSTQKELSALDYNEFSTNLSCVVMNFDSE